MDALGDHPGAHGAGSSRTKWIARAIPLGPEGRNDAPARAHALAATLASGAPLAMAGLRRTLRAIGKAPIDPAEREELEALRVEAFASEDAVEARTAMREKRPPRWKGR